MAEVSVEIEQTVGYSLYGQRKEKNNVARTYNLAMANPRVCLLGEAL